MARLRPFFETQGMSEIGFDKLATPRWVMVATPGSHEVVLSNGAGLVVKSRNENIASIEELCQHDEPLRACQLRQEIPYPG